MADTSVGKIGLELEVQGDLAKQIQDIAGGLQKSLQNTLNAFQKSLNATMSKSAAAPQVDKGFKKMFGGMGSFAKASMQRVTGEFDNATAKSSQSVSQMQKNLGSLESSLEKSQGKISELQGKLADLYAQQDAIIDRYRNLPAFSGLSDDDSLAVLLEMDSGFKKINTEVVKLESQMEPLKAKSNATKVEIQQLSSAMAQAGKNAGNAGNKIQTAGDQTKRTGEHVSVAGKKFGGFAAMVNRSLMTVMRRLFVYNLIYKGIRSIVNYMSSGLKTNKDFANSLATVQTNLKVAFQPIYDAILPALTALMQVLARVTTYIASFTSALFGKTYKQSYNAAKGLDAAKKGMDGYGSASKKAAKEARGLMAFDEINLLPSADAGDAGGGTDNSPMVAPSFEMGPIEASVKGFLDRLSKLLEPAKAALGRLKEAFEPLKENLFAGLKWLLDNVLIPLGKWTATEVVPRFIDLLAGAIRILNETIEALKPLFSWLWENLFLPIAQWTGGIILDVLDGINSGLSTIADWISNNQGAVETMAIIIGSFAAAWGLVNIAMTVWNVVAAIATGITTGLGAAIAFLTSPIGIAIAIIGALIAIGVLLYKNWDKVKEWLTNAWNTIKNAAVNSFTAVKNSISNTWNSIKSSIHNTWNGIKTWISNLWNGIRTTATNVFNGIKNGIVNAFNSVKTKISEIWGSIWGTIKGFINKIIDGMNGMIGGLNKLKFSAPDWVPLIGGKTFGINIPKIPRLARGGIVDQPTLAMVGERGREAVMPLENNTGWINELASKIAAMMSGGNESLTLQVIIGGDMLLEKVISEAERKNAKAGRTVIPIGVT